MFPDKTIREIFMNTHELQNLHVVLRDRLKDRIENWWVAKSLNYLVNRNVISYTFCFAFPFMYKVLLIALVLT